MLITLRWKTPKMSLVCFWYHLNFIYFPTFAWQLFNRLLSYKCKHLEFVIMTLKLHHECTCVEICLENVECSPKSGYLVAESSMNTKNRPSNAKPKVDEIASVQDLDSIHLWHQEERWVVFSIMKNRTYH